MGRSTYGSGQLPCQRHGVKAGTVVCLDDVLTDIYPKHSQPRGFKLPASHRLMPSLPELGCGVLSIYGPQMSTRCDY